MPLSAIVPYLQLLDDNLGIRVNQFLHLQMALGNVDKGRVVTVQM